MKPDCFICDVDGIMTSGHFIYDEGGKKYKVFGPDDHDALKILLKYIPVIFISGDKKGFKISQKRISIDMGFPLYLVSTKKRLQWINENYEGKNIIYMGDGIFDSIIMKNVFYSISTSKSDELTKKLSNYITSREGGNRAVSEAVIHIIKVYFNNKIDTVEGLLSEI